MTQIIPAKQEKIDIFTKKLELLTQIVSKTMVSETLGIRPQNLYMALTGVYSTTTYMNYNTTLDSMAEEIIAQASQVKNIK